LNLDLLKRTRLYKGFKQYEVADNIGISRQAYNSKEKGKSPIYADEISKIILFLSLTFDEVNEIFFDNIISK